MKVKPAPIVFGVSWQGPVAWLGSALAVLVFLVAVLRWPDPGGGVTGVIVAALVLCATIDILSMRIPNAITYPAFVLVMFSAAIAGFDTLGTAALGALVGGGIIGVLSLVSRGQVGMGDMKLSLVGGAIVGGRYTLGALLIGSLSALPVVGVLLLLRRIGRRQPIPYGPYLALGFVAITLAAGSVLTR